MRLFVGILCAVLLLGGLIVMVVVTLPWAWAEVLIHMGLVMGGVFLFWGLVAGVAWGFKRE